MIEKQPAMQNGSYLFQSESREVLDKFMSLLL